MTFGVWFILLLLLLISALYVAAEFAAVSVRHSRIQQSAEQGSSLAKRLWPFLAKAQNLDRYIAACQIGITLSSLILGAYGQSALAPVLVPLFEELGWLQGAAAESTAAIIVLLGLTVLHMVLSELIPKSLALQYPSQMALGTVVPMIWSLRIFSPFIRFLNGSALLMLKAVGVEPTGHRHIHSPGEIELLIAESRKGGVLLPTESRRLRQALRLRLRTVRELMTPRTRVEAVYINTPLSEAVRHAVESPYTRFPIYDESLDDIKGFVHARDLGARFLDKSRSSTLRDLIQPVLFVPETTTADRLLTRMREERRQFGVVVDEFGGTAGLITIADVLRDIVGSVADEFKQTKHLPEWLPDGRVRLPGSLRVDQAGAILETDWTGEALTVGGLVMEALERIPNEGESVVIDDIEVQVERTRGPSIESVLARRVTAAVKAVEGGDG